MVTRTSLTQEQETLHELEAYVEDTLACPRPSSAGIGVSRGGEMLLERYLRGVEPQPPERPVNRDSFWSIRTTS